MIGLAAGIGIPVLLLLWFIGVYNGLVGLRNQVRNAWAQIEVQLKRRHDLIPNLVETVKGYAAHEKTTLENVIKARNMAMSAGGVADKAQAENMLTGALKSLFALAESYPDLKANQNFLALQEELTSTENKVAFSRQHYNDSVMIYNTKIQSIPANIVAGIGGFKQEQMFEIQDAAEREVPKVSF